MTPAPKTAADVGGPVSEFLEADVRGWIRRNRIVVWLDLDGHYVAFVDRLMAARAAGALPYPVYAFRGSYLELMMALEGVAGGVEKTPLLIHLPGFNEETVKQTPLLELRRAGVRYQKALSTLVNEAAAGRVPPDAIAAYQARADLTLAAADDWLHTLLTDRSGGAAGDDGFAAHLRSLSPIAFFDDLLNNGEIARSLARPGDAAPSDRWSANVAALWERLAAWIGLSATWRETALPNPQAGDAGDVVFAAASWALGVEYVHDLKRPPVASGLETAQGLPRGVVDNCRQIAEHLRMRHAAFYRRTAQATEALLADEIEAANAEDLGKIDTFPFEEDKVLKAALSALHGGNWRAAAAWSDQRLDGDTTTDAASAGAASASSFWLGQDPARKSAWQLVHAAVRLDRALDAAGERLSTAPSLEAAADHYVKHGAPVDQVHRHLEQLREASLYPQLPEFEGLRAALDQSRRRWRRWADAWARDFNALCRRYGFLPSPTYQQRTLFDDIVRPLSQESGTTAYFLVDAFRYEMAEELYRRLEETAATNVHLNARFAELPTVTEIGMNALAPVSINGRLSPVPSALDGGVQGFASGEFRVTNPDTRKRAIHDRVGGAACPLLPLDDVVNRDAAWLKRSIAQAKLVIVHSREIDKAGENEFGPAVFDTVMQKLRAAWTLLRDAGVRRFVFTGDHGFLLLDDSAATAQPHGRRSDPHPRYVFSPAAADHNGEVRVALSDLNYVDQPGYVMFPETTAVFDTGRRTARFVHGGNSLQERLIPVLTVLHRTAAGGSIMQYAIHAEPADGMMGMHCLNLRVDVVAQQALAFNSPKEIELALRVPNAAGVQVELAAVRGNARITGASILAAVGADFELFFRLTGSTDARVQVELYHPSAAATVQPTVPEARFAVSAGRSMAEASSAVNLTPSADDNWLDTLPDDADAVGVRALFAHLAEHGSVSESEAIDMLGGQRALRRFSLKFEEYAERAPFTVRIDVIGGVKRYVREGSSS